MALVLSAEELGLLAKIAERGVSDCLIEEQPNWPERTPARGSKSADEYLGLYIERDDKSALIAHAKARNTDLSKLTRAILRTYLRTMKEMPQ